MEYARAYCYTMPRIFYLAHISFFLAMRRSVTMLFHLFAYY